MKGTATGAFVVSALLCLAAGHGMCSPNYGAGWALHYAGPHDAKGNTCNLELMNCPWDFVVDAPGGPGRYDVYVIGVQTTGIAGTRYGICCDGNFYFYGWTNCADLEIATDGWPGCGEGNAQTWTVEQTAGHITMGILDVYVYGPSELTACVDPRVDFAEWCDGTEPEPMCNQVTLAQYFGRVSFGGSGYVPCPWGAVENHTWGMVKALYQGQTAEE